MMTMDITKTEPNVGPNNLQNSTSQQNTNNANGGNSITSLPIITTTMAANYVPAVECRLGEVGSTLYTKGNLMLCKRDYLRLFGNTGYCAACSKVIPAF
ncbi:hypothetical protein DOY81_015466, partial [Sarcophaga bullata]